MKADEIAAAWSAFDNATGAVPPAAALVERAKPTEPPHWLLQKLRFALDEARKTISVDHPVRLHIEAAMLDIDFYETATGKTEDESDPPAVADRASAPAPLEDLVKKWRERDLALCRRADSSPTTAYARTQADRAECYGRCADELEAALRAVPSRREQEK